MRFHTTCILPFLALAILFLGIACTKKQKQPPPPPQPTLEQRKQDQARRWQTLAANAAKEVQGAVMVREDLVNVPIYVRPPMDTQFSQTFGQLLTSALVSLGMRVSIEQEDALLLDYYVQDGVVVTVTLRYNNRYVMHSSQIAFIGEQGMGYAAKDAVWNRFAKRRPVYIP